LYLKPEEGDVVICSYGPTA